MQILDKAITPDGIEIELHDLSGEHRLPDYNGMIINFCTVAKNTFPPNKGWYSQKGKEFRSYIVLVNTQKICSRKIMKH